MRDVQPPASMNARVGDEDEVEQGENDFGDADEVEVGWGQGVMEHLAGGV